MKEKKCSKCHTTFHCHNPEPGCWCEKVYLKPETLGHLKETYDDCLCSTCLKGFEQREDLQKEELSS